MKAAMNPRSYPRGRIAVSARKINDAGQPAWEGLGAVVRPDPDLPLTPEQLAILRQRLSSMSLTALLRCLLCRMDS